MKFLVPFFHKKVLFLANIECFPKFLEYALPFYIWSSAISRLQSHCEETVSILPLSPQEFLVLI